MTPSTPLKSLYITISTHISYIFSSYMVNQTDQIKHNKTKTHEVVCHQLKNKELTSDIQ
jgi:hypothetical protein